MLGGGPGTRHLASAFLFSHNRKAPCEVQNDAKQVKPWRIAGKTHG